MTSPRPSHSLDPRRRVLLALRHEFAAGITVASGALAALVWSAISSSSYEGAMNARISASWLRSAHLDSLRQFSVNATMTIFFFAVGLELSKEFRVGALRQRHLAIIPIVAALGGMLTCAGAYALFGVATSNHDITTGWGVPMATDIAFTLGALSLAGRRVPSSVRLFLLALAVADDLFSVIVLAAKSPLGPSVAWLALLVVVVAVAIAARRRLRSSHYLVVLVVAWLALVLAHIEPALAGVAVGVLVPFGAKSSGQHLERVTQPWSNGLALPLFALCACGVAWSRVAWNAHVLEIVGGLVLARLGGKVLGISLSVTLARRWGVSIPEGVHGVVLWASSALCAIGFTVPLLFAGSLYSTSSSAYAASTVGLLVASLIAAALGVGALRIIGSTRRNSLS